MVYRIHGISGVVYFAMPSAFLVMLLLGNEFVRAHGSVKHRFANLLSMFAPFGLGLAIPIVSYLILYSLAHSTGPLFHDLFDGTEKQLLFASTAAPPVLFMIPVFPVALLIAVALASHRQGQVVYGSLLAMYLGGILVLSSRYQLAYAHGWCSLAYAIPILTLAGAVTIGTSQVADIRKQQIMLLVAAMAVISLVQFPFSAPVYFCYVAPLAILAAVGVFSSLKHQPRLALGALIAFYLTFAVVRVTPGFSLGTFQHSSEVKTRPLTLARAGNLRVDPRDAEVYEKLIPAIKSRAGSNFIYAAPDCPEIYFLADLLNPTRTIFDFREEPVGRQSRILRTLENHDVNVIAINRQPQFSGTLEPDLLEALRTLYPDSEEIGHFQVRWKTVQPAQTKRND
jgi:hypothetical protein